MELSDTSRNRDKVCWTRNKITSQESTQWMAQGETLSGSRATDKRGLRHDEIPGCRARELQHQSGNIKHGRASDHDKPIKQRYYTKNPKVQGEVNVNVDELFQLGYIEH